MKGKKRAHYNGGREDAESFDDILAWCRFIVTGDNYYCSIYLNLTVSSNILQVDVRKKLPQLIHLIKIKISFY